MVGLLDYLDPDARMQAGYGALGQLGGGLLAAGARSYDPGQSGRMMGQALGSFAPAYQQGLQSQAQMQLQGQDLAAERAWQDAFGPNANPNHPLAQSVPANVRPYMGLMGRQAGMALLGRLATNGRPMAPEEIASRGLTPGLPWHLDDHGMPTLPAHDPRVQEAGAAATARGDVGVRGVDLGFTGQRGYPNVGGGGAAVPPMPGAPAAGGRVPAGGPVPAQTAGTPHRAGDPVPNTPGWRYTGIPETDASIDAYAADQSQAPMPTGPGPRPAVGAQVAQAPTDPTAPTMRNVPGYGRVFGSDQTAVQRARGTGETQDLYTRNTIIPQINSGVQLIQTTRQMRDSLSDPSLNTGPGAGMRNMAAELLRSWGGESGARLAANIQSPGFAGLEGLSSRAVLDALGGSLGTGISNADRDAIARTVPNPFQSRETLDRFIGMIEDRALSNIRTAHTAYQRTVPNFNAQTDPITSHLTERLNDMGIDPATALAARRAAARQQAPTTEQPQPQPRGAADVPAVPLPRLPNGNPNVQELRDGQIYTSPNGMRGRWNARRMGFEPVGQ